MNNQLILEASSHGSIQALEELLSKGVDVNFKHAINGWYVVFGGGFRVSLWRY